MQPESQASLDRPLDSTALRRLQAEVASGAIAAATRGYNRTYNRHNR